MQWAYNHFLCGYIYPNFDIFVPPPTISGEHHILCRPSVRPSVRELSVPWSVTPFRVTRFPFTSNKRISMKLGTKIHHLSGRC